LIQFDGFGVHAAESFPIHQRLPETGALAVNAESTDNSLVLHGERFHIRADGDKRAPFGWNLDRQTIEPDFDLLPS
jgi:hypothetical protein